MKNIITLFVCLCVFSLNSIAGEPGAVEQPQKISISTTPPSVPPVVNNLSSSSQSIVFGEKRLPETIEESPIVEKKPTEETDGALYRLRDGVVQTLTFWRPWAYSNNPEKNPDALVDAEGIIEKTDQIFRNFVVRGSTNSACRLVDGVWRIGTFPFPEAQN